MTMHELQGITSSHFLRGDDTRVFSDPAVKKEIDEMGIEIISWQQLRDGVTHLTRNNELEFSCLSTARGWEWTCLTSYAIGVSDVQYLTCGLQHKWYFRDGIHMNTRHS